MRGVRRLNWWKGRLEILGQKLKMSTSVAIRADRHDTKC